MFQEQKSVRKSVGWVPDLRKEKFLVTVKLLEMLHELFATCLRSGGYTGSQTKAEPWEKWIEGPISNWACRSFFKILKNWEVVY